MCGIAGAFIHGSDNDGISQAVSLMCQQMHARGPDDTGYWSDLDNGVALGHQRLSIIDLSERAKQPMISEDGRYTIVFNGEIYNYKDLRYSLEVRGEIFLSKSDTEVILKLYHLEGSAMLSRLRGMFAIAIWDRKARRIFLARDPYGIKPLYIANCQNGWLFASQIKALLATNLVDRAPSAFGQVGFWLLGSVPEPYTWFQEITALPAGTWCYLKEDGVSTPPKCYWDIADAWREAPECNFGANEIQEIVRSAVSNSVRQHLVADVPVGIFLSGGIDSGALAGLMRDQSQSPIQGITIAFDEFRGRHEDEVPGAREIAKRYGINHHVRTVTKKEFEDDLPKIFSSMDQPSVDGINTWFASKAVAELGLKVVISGVGGDELFYGYPSFQQLPVLVSLCKTLERLPGARAAANFIFDQKARRSGNSRWRWLTEYGDNLYGAYWLRRGLFAPEELQDLMGAALTNEALSEMDPESLVESMVGSLSADSMAAVGQIESMVYLRNQLLRDSDWASMAHSVELRTPLVDAWLLKDLMPVLRSFYRFKGKSLLAASPLLPLGEDLVSRKKTGFSIPLGVWGKETMPSSPGVYKQAPTQGGGDSRIWAKTIAKMAYST
jgi:asparagine synthase (glutamine-hydrolysing)